jgi:hypothetical protein
VPASRLQSWSNWLTRASSMSVSLLTTSMSGATFGRRTRGFAQRPCGP